MVGPDLSGATLDGRYRLVSLLGAGGMGQVYEGIHLSLERRVAVKVLPSHLSEDARFRVRFAREARAAARITHRNIVQIMDFGESPAGPVYFVMEFLHGRDLGALLRETGRLPWPRARHLLLQAVSALKAAHARGIIHRDIKPGNCLVVDLLDEGLVDVVKLLDFGIAKVLAEATSENGTLVKPLTGTGEIMGTASYMSPEQARCEPMDARSDVYSLGIMAYEMLTGRVPFAGINPIHVVTRHLYDRPEPPHRWVPDMIPEVEQLVLRAIAKDASARFQSMADVEAAVLKICDDGAPAPTPATATVGDLELLEETRKTRRASNNTQNNPTIMLHGSVAKSPPARLQAQTSDSFEDAETPDALVLHSRFGEPFPLRFTTDAEPHGQRLDEDEDGVAAEPGDVAVVIGNDGRTDIAISPTEYPRPLRGSENAVNDDSQHGGPDIETLIDAPRTPEAALVFVDAPSTSSQHIPSSSMVNEESSQRQPKGNSWARAVLVVVFLGFVAIAMLITSDRFGSRLSEAGANIETQASAEPSPASNDLAPPMERDFQAAQEDQEETVARSKNSKASVAVPSAMLDSHGTQEQRSARTEKVVTPTTFSQPVSIASGTGPSSTETEATTPTTSTTPEQAPRKLKPYETDQCKHDRERAAEYYAVNDHDMVIELTSSNRCWPPSLKLRRTKMLRNAFDSLINTKRYEKCEEAGRGIEDVEVKKAADLCKKRLEQSRQATKAQSSMR